MSKFSFFVHFFEDGRAGNAGAAREADHTGSARSGDGCGTLSSLIRTERGSITIYMVLMSILVVGAMGLILDSGRVYATHSRMQAFADHIALAAANELDGEPDAIERASQIAYEIANDGIGGENNITSGHATAIAQLSFFSDLASNETGGERRRQSELSDSSEFHLLSLEGAVTADGGIPLEDQIAAQYVSVQVQAVEARSLAYLMVAIGDSLATSLLNTFSSGSSVRVAPERTGSYSIGANATAGLRRMTCASLSTLAFCNPWERIPDAQNPDPDSPSLDPLNDPSLNLSGRSLMFFAPNYHGQEVATRRLLNDAAGGATSGRDVGSIYDYSVRNQMVTISDPIEDSTGVCGLNFLQNFFTLDGEFAGNEEAPDYLEARDRCLMARSVAEPVCYEDKVGIRPASGPTVSSAVNVAFDIWNEPFDRVIQQGAQVGTTGQSLASFFEPDLVVSNRYERMTDLPTPNRFGVLGEDGTTPAPILDGVIDNDDYVAFGQMNPSASSALTDEELEDLNAFQIVNYLYYTVPAPETRWIDGNVHNFGGMHSCHDGTYSQAAAAFSTGTLPPAGNSCTEPFIGNDPAVNGDLNTLFLNTMAEYYDVPTRDRALRTYFNEPANQNGYASYRLERAQKLVDLGLENDTGAPAILPAKGATGRSHADGLLDSAYSPELPFIPEAQADNRRPRGDNALVYYEESFDEYRDHPLPAGTDGFTLTEAQRQALLVEESARPLKTDPIDIDREHDYPIVSATSPETHAMESFGSRTGATSLEDPSRERRVLRAAFVNCHAAAAEGIGEDGLYRADVVRILDVFLPSPAGYFCGHDDELRPLDGSDPDTQVRVSNGTCALTDQVETQLFVETIRPSQEQEVERFTVQLVR